MFYIEKDDKIILFDEDRQRLENTLEFMPQYTGLEILETDRPIDGWEWADTEEYKKRKEAEERERIGNLQVTKRVFALGLQQMGISYSQLKELIATSEQAELEWDLCVELERKNPLLDVMGAQLGVSPEMLDYIFRKANGEEVEPPVVSEQLME